MASSETPLASPATSGAESSARYEIKLPFLEAAIAQVRALVRSHPAAFREAYPARQVNNLYFDDDAFTCLVENLAGVPDRAKLRLRWYGDGSEPVAAQLEVKRKHGQYGSKLVQPLAGMISPADLHPAALADRLRREPLGALARFATTLHRAVLVNRYHREYLVSADRRIRLTIDSGIRSEEPASYRRGAGSGAPPRNRPRTGVGVVELKCDVADSARLREVTRTLPLPTAAFSKYARGVL